MRSFFFFLGFITVTGFSFAQNWRDLIQKPNANFYEIQREFNMHYKEKEALREKEEHDINEESDGFEGFKRWEYFVEPRVYPSGDLALLNQTAKNFQDFLTRYHAEDPNQDLQLQSRIAAPAVWTPMGPFGSISGISVDGQYLKNGRLNFITIHPSNPLQLFVGAPAGGLWTSTDGGISWTTNTNNLPVIGCSDLAIDPINTNIMYLATGDAVLGNTQSIGVLRSTDGGLTWNSTGPLGGNQIRRLIINPVNPQILIAATNTGVYRTSNGCTTWTQVDSNWLCYDLEFQPGNPSIVYAGSWGDFKRSSDGGITWIQISNGIPNTGVYKMAVAVTPANPNVVYVVAGDNSNSTFLGFYKSLDAGVTFSIMPTTLNLFGWSDTGNDPGGSAYRQIAASPTNSNEVVVGALNVWRTPDGGGTWGIYGHWLGTNSPFIHADQQDIEFDANGTLYGINDGSIFKRTGSTWTDMSVGMNISQIYKIGTSALTPNKWITGHQDNGTPIYSSGTYSASLGSDGMDCFIDRTNDNNLFASWYFGNLKRSVNGGATWNAYTSGLTQMGSWVTPWKQDPQSPGIIYAGCTDMFKSVLATGTWTQIGTIPGSGWITEFAVAPSNNLVIYAVKGGTAPAIYKTNDGGVSWNNVTATVPLSITAMPTYVFIHPNTPNKAWLTLSGYSAGNKIFYTNNGGASWTNVTSNLPNIPANCGIYQNGSPDRIYIGMDAGVYYKDSLSTNWTLYNSGLPNTPISDMEISPADPNKLIASTYGRGVWKVDLANQPVSAFNYNGSSCILDPIQFNDASVNSPTTWSWSVTPNTGITINAPNLQNPSITFANPGTYTVALFTTNNVGPGNIYTQTITINPLPTVYAITSATQVCLDNVVWLTGIGANTYTWQPQNLTGNPVTYTPNATQTYTCYGTDVNGCIGKKLLTVSVKICSGLLQNTGETVFFTVYPNPVSESLVITYQTSGTSNVTIELSDPFGKVILKKDHLFSKNNFSTNVDISTLANGVYFMTLIPNEGQSKTIKFIKE